MHAHNELKSIRQINLPDQKGMHLAMGLALTKLSVMNLVRPMEQMRVKVTMLAQYWAGLIELVIRTENQLAELRLKGLSMALK